MKKSDTFYIVGEHAFVALPSYRGLYLKTHPCVAVVCPVCGSQRGWPCGGATGFTSSTHKARRLLFAVEMRRAQSKHRRRKKRSA